jgi:hypothetical protein
MNFLETILGFKDINRTATISLICCVILVVVAMTIKLADLDRRTIGIINLYIFYPTLLIGLFNSVSTILTMLKYRDIKTKFLIYSLPIPTFTIYLIAIILKDL